jgi:hypothetical protein
MDPATRSMNGLGSFNLARFIKSAMHASGASRPCQFSAYDERCHSLYILSMSAGRRVVQVDVFYTDDMDRVDLMNNLFECKANKFPGILLD